MTKAIEVYLVICISFKDSLKYDYCLFNVSSMGSLCSSEACIIA